MASPLMGSHMPVSTMAVDALMTFVPTVPWSSAVYLMVQVAFFAMISSGLGRAVTVSSLLNPG